MSTPTPPGEFLTWLDYAVATMDARGAYLDRMFHEDEIPSQDDIRAAVQEELDHLRQKAVMPWVGILENWKSKLSKRLGRSEEVIFEDNLLATDFSDAGVHIHFEDGTDLTFRRAFYLGETPADGGIHRVVVFTEHCGYHEFWIGPDDRIEEISHRPKTRSAKDFKLTDLISQAQDEVAQRMLAVYKFDPVSEEELAWVNMVPVGREFGSPDYERLMQQDLIDLRSNLSSLIEKCSDSGFDREHRFDPTEHKDAVNVKIALLELGHDVEVAVAAAVWRHYSNSLMAGWMSGAETVKSAKRTLLAYCTRRPAD